MAEMPEMRLEVDLDGARAELKTLFASQDDRDDLAHEIAEESSKSAIECNTSAADADGARWHSISSANDDARWFVERAVRYLEGEGILKRAPSNPDLVSWDDDDLDEVGA